VTRGVVRRQSGAAEDIETLQGKNNASTRRFRAVEKCRPPLARRSQSRGSYRSCPQGSCHRRVYRVVLPRTASFIQSNCRPLPPVLSRTEEPCAPRSSYRYAIPRRSKVPAPDLRPWLSCYGLEAAPEPFPQMGPPRPRSQSDRRCESQPPVSRQKNALLT
jgi:hypothetical protein